MAPVLNTKAMVSGSGGYITMLYGGLTPEIINPVHRSSSLWVFELPEHK